MTTPPVLNPQLLSVLQGALAKAQEVKHDPTRFKVYQGRELDFVRDVFGIPAWSPEKPDVVGLTPDQVVFIKAVFADRRVAVRAGHSTGKSFALALIVLIQLYVWAGKVVTTASTWKQVEEVLWGEIKSLFAKARVPLPAKAEHPLKTELAVEGQCFAIGVSTNDAVAFQGRHHPRLMAIIDEAPGVEDSIHEAIASLATGSKNKIVMVGNPVISSGAFYEAFKRGTWTRLHMSCLNHPNILLGREVIPGAVTQVWIDEAKEKWGEDSPIYVSRVLGEFPTMAANQVIPLAWVERACDEAKRAGAIKEAIDRGEPVILAVDVARYGDNLSVMAHRRGNAITQIEHWGMSSTMETTGRIAKTVNDYQQAGTPVQLVVVDEVGLGGGVLDRALELGLPIVGFHSGRSASSKTLYNNRRSEGWWAVRKRFEHSIILIPKIDRLVDDLKTPTYKLSSSGRIEVETKEQLARRGVPSSDFADAVIMAFATDGDLLLDDVIDDSAIRDQSLLASAPAYATGDDADVGDQWSDGSFADLPLGF